MEIFIKNKKILAVALCLSITAGQANAISWSSVGSTIGRATTNFCKSAIKDFKAPTWQNSKWMILTSFATAATYAIGYNLKKMGWQPGKKLLGSETKKQVIAFTAIEATLLYALSPIAFNLKYIYKPLTAIHYLCLARVDYELIAFTVKRWLDKMAKKYIFSKMLAAKKIDCDQLIENKSPIEWIIENRKIIDFEKRSIMANFIVSGYTSCPFADAYKNVFFKSDKLTLREITQFRVLEKKEEKHAFIDKNKEKIYVFDSKLKPKSK